MTLIFFLSGSSGSRLLPSFISSPEPLDHQWFPLMPFPMNTTAKRLGSGPVFVAAPQTGIDSSHGSAIVTPAPRRKTLRDGCDPGMLFPFLYGAFGPAPIQKLGTRDDALDQRPEMISIGGQPGAHLFDGGLIRHHKLPPDR